MVCRLHSVCSFSLSGGRALAHNGISSDRPLALVIFGANGIPMFYRLAWRSSELEQYLTSRFAAVAAAVGNFVGTHASTNRISLWVPAHLLPLRREVRSN